MNAKVMLLGALLAGSLLGAGSLSAPAAAQTRCWAGYHVDRRGDCQPNVPTVDQRCGPGLEAQVWPNGPGYICVPIPQGY